MIYEIISSIIMATVVVDFINTGTQQANKALNNYSQKLLKTTYNIAPGLCITELPAGLKFYK